MKLWNGMKSRNPNGMRPTIQKLMPFENPNGAFGGGGKSSFERVEENLF